MSPLSESKCLTKLRLFGADNLTQNEIYRACVFSANSGVLLNEISHLNVYQRLLLDVRLLLSQKKFEEADLLLLSLTKNLELNSELRADLHFLKAIYAFRTLKMDEFEPNMIIAKNLYSVQNDKYRELRTAINIAAFKDEPYSMNCGTLRAYYQESLRIEAHDLAANICKANAVNLLVAGDLKSVIYFANKAIEHFQLDGCSEDVSLTYALAAIAYLLDGDLEKAQKSFSAIMVHKGKVEDYIKTFETLKAGRIPKAIANLSLAKVPWKTLLKRKSSITQKILSALKLKALSKFEVIESVWGKDATDPSYEARFYNALQQLKKQNEVIAYDGEKYFAS